MLFRPFLSEWDILADMVTRETIDAAVRILAEAARPARIVLFGSHARGDAREDSDVDLLVIEPQVEDRAREMVRLRRPRRHSCVLGGGGRALERAAGLCPLLGVARRHGRAWLRRALGSASV